MLEGGRGEERDQWQENEECEEKAYIGGMYVRNVESCEGIIYKKQ